MDIRTVSMWLHSRASNRVSYISIVQSVNPLPEEYAKQKTELVRISEAISWITFYASIGLAVLLCFFGVNWFWFVPLIALGISAILSVMHIKAFSKKLIHYKYDCLAMIEKAYKENGLPALNYAPRCCLGAFHT